MNKPRISVVIPTYQHAQTIGDCLESIFAQTFKDVEIIVVNDGSTDQTKEILADYADRITVIHQQNKGANPARNRGLKEAKGEFVIFADADVHMKPHMLETMVKTLDAHPEHAFAYSSFYFGWKKFTALPFSAEEFRKRNLAHSTTLVRRADFPGFDEEIKRLQDWDVWLTMLKCDYTGIAIPEVLFSVDISGESRIGSSWLPRILYKLPWKWLPWKPKQIEKFDQAYQILKQKHQL